MRTLSIPVLRGNLLHTPWIIAVTVLTVALLSPAKITVYGAPADFDSNETPFPLEFQSLPVDDDFHRKPSAIDSYGDPIDTLKPIETPDGRKVISAQGLQFEIPNYASGITDIKKPSDDLLPPFIDPIAVAVSNTHDDQGRTTVYVENAPIVELTPDYAQRQEESSHAPTVLDPLKFELPDYIKELMRNDPDIAGPVDYIATEGGTAPRVIAWDLLPPFEDEPKIITKENYTPKSIIGIVDPNTNNVKFSLSTTPVNTRFTAPITQGKVSVVNVENNKPTIRTKTNGDEDEYAAATNNAGERGQGQHAFINQNYRGNVHYTNPTRVPRTTTTSGTPTTEETTTTTTTHRTTTTTTPRITTTTTTTMTTTTTTRPKPTTTRRITPLITTTGEPLDPADFYRLEGGDSYTLPSWLADIDDPDLNVAVGFDVPTDLHEYNITIANDLVPPLEPYDDLKDIQLPAPVESSIKIVPTTTTTTTSRRPTTTTTRRLPITTTSTTARPHWVRAYPTTTTQKPVSAFNSFAANPRQGPHLDQMHNTFTPPTSTTPFINQNSKLSTQTGVTTPIPSHAPASHTQNQESPMPFNPDSPVDRLKSSEAETEAAISQPTTVQPKQNNPFLPMVNAGAYQPKSTNPFLPVRNNGAYQPKPFIQNTGAYTTPATLTTTSTTTTTTTQSPSLEVNPFDSATIPSWLQPYDYPDLGPGVNFTYYPESKDSDININIVPPLKFDPRERTDINKPAPNFVPTPPPSFNPFNFPQNIPDASPSPPSSSPAGTTISSPTITSKVTAPFSQSFSNNRNEFVRLPQQPTNDNDNRRSGTAAADVYANPKDVQVQKTSSSFNPNFAAPFDTDVAQQPAAPADQASFPPSQGSATGSILPVKTIFTKSDEGKVITNKMPSNPFLPTTQPSAKPFDLFSAIGNQQKDITFPDSNQFGGNFAPPGNSPSTIANIFSPVATGFSKAPFPEATAPRPAPFVPGVKYTGKFGGPEGFLGSGKIGSAFQTVAPVAAVGPKIVPTAAPRPIIPQANIDNRNVESTAAASGQKYTGTFRGPPGVLVPFGG